MYSTTISRHDARRSSSLAFAFAPLAFAVSSRARSRPLALASVPLAARALFGARAASPPPSRAPALALDPPPRALAASLAPHRAARRCLRRCDAPIARERPRHRPPRVARRRTTRPRRSPRARSARARVHLDLARVCRAVVCRPVGRRVCEPFAVVKPPRTPFIFSVIGRPSTSSDQSSDRSRHTATTRRGASIDLDRRESRGNVRARVESSRRAWRTRGEARRWPRGDNRSRLVAIGRYVKTRRRRREGGRARAFATSLEVNTRIDSFERARETRARGSRSGLR